jgi:integrase
MQPEQPRPKVVLVTEDSFAALVRLFMSPANPKWFGEYSDSTRTTWGRELIFMSRPDCLGALSLHEIRPSLVQAYFDGIADRPGKCASGLAVLKQLEKWAVVRELLPRQITLGVEVAEGEDDGHIPWTDDQVAIAERHALPWLSRAVTLGANTGQRGSDLIRMTPNDLETFEGISGFNVTQKKTKRQVWLPITSPLAAAMQGWERRPGPYLLTPEGTPMTRKQLTDGWAYERKRNPELRGHLQAELVMHGLRGTACVRLRRSGATIPQIADMVGMSVQMVERYCRFSVQRENAVAAVHHLERTLRERQLDMSKKQAK